MSKIQLPPVLVRRVLTAVMFLTAATVQAAGVEPAKLSLPSGPGSIEGLGRNFVPSLSSGTASYGIDIAVPPAIGGFGPSLALEYDSGGGVSELGLGWRLGGLPSLRRRTEDGLPRFDATDRFELVGLGIPSALLEVSAGTFRPEQESGAFVRVRRSADGLTWEARDKAGTTYRFGGEGCTESEGANTTNFLLCEQYDLHGHRIEYAWNTTTRHGLLQSVTWNAQTPESTIVVTFGYETRPDVFERFSSGIRQLLDQRISRIEVTRGGATVRSYALSYNVAASGQSSVEGDNRSLLTRVHVTGTDGVTALPDLSLEYTGIHLTASGAATAMTSPPGRSPGEANVALADLNGDSLPDLLVAQAGQYRSCLNHDGKSWKSANDWATANSPSLSLGATGVQLADLDGDGAIDLVAKSGVSDFRYFPAIDDTHFGSSVAISTVPNFTFEDPNVRLADMDGDRRTDVAVTTATGLAIGYNLNGKDWSVPTTVGVIDSAQSLMFSDGHTQLCDVNGDRVQDICYLRSGSLVYYLGRGRGRFEAARTASGVPQFDISTPYRLVDLNGDGWVDLVRVGVSQVDYVVATSAGLFTTTGSLSGVPTKASTTTVEFADMNGSGTTDVVWVDVSRSAATAWQYLELFPEGRSGLLKTIDNGLGKVTRITYAPAALGAARSRDEGTPWTTRLNVGMPVVTEVRNQSALGDPDIVARFDSRNGAWDPSERTFAAFGRGIQTDVGDDATPTLVTESTFELGLITRVLRGHPLSVEQRDANGSVFTRTTSSYTSRALDSNLVKYAFKSSELIEHIEGQSGDTVITTLTEWDQDKYGNAIKESKWGIVDGSNKLAGSDEAVTLRTFANNEDDWILGRIASEELQDANGNRVALRRSYYDGTAFQGLALGEVTRGDLRRVESWISGDHFSDELRADHDKDGNIIASFDARNARSEFDYDAANQYLSAERRFVDDERFLEWKSTFDGRFGTVTSLTNPNGQISTVFCDSLGRIEKLVRPGDSSELPTARYEYHLGTRTSQAVTHARKISGSPEEQVSVAHVDGFGRKRATLVQVSQAGSWVLTDFVRLDARGNAVRTAYPTFVDTADMPPLASAYPGTTASRDAVGRETKSLAPDSSQAQTVYGPLAVTRYDENDLDPLSTARDTPTTTRLDGLGRTVSIVERDGPREITTGSYTYNPAGKLSSLADALGRVRHYEHDGRGRRVKVNDPNAGSWIFEFTDGNDLQRRIDPTGRQLRYEYDPLGRTLAEYHSLDGISEVLETGFHYDDPAQDHPELGNTRGQLSWIEDQAGIEYFGYDIRGRQSDHVRRWSDGVEHYTWRDFDAQDHMVRRGFPDHSHLTFDYDDRGLLAGIGGVAHDFEWTAHGALRSAILANGVTETRDYDNRLRLSQMVASGQEGAVLRGLTFGFDRASRITSIADLRARPLPEEDLSAAFGYDARNRLRTATYASGTTNWTVDDLSKVTSVSSDFDDPHLNVTNVYGEDGAGPDAMTHHGAEKLSYDAAGRVIQDSERTYGWDAKGRLAKVTRGNVVEEYTYDHEDHRVLKSTTTDGSASVTRYVDQDVEERGGQLVRYVFLGSERLARLDPTDVGGRIAPATFPQAGATVATGERTEVASQLVVRVIHGLNWCAILGLLAASGAALIALRLSHSTPGPRWLVTSATTLVLLGVTVPTVVSCGENAKGAHLQGFRGESIPITALPCGAEFYLADHQGSPLVRVDAHGTVVGTTAYHPYGHVRSQSGSGRDPFGFVGNEEDRGTGVSNFHARPYRPELGAFLAVDPIALFAAEKHLQQPVNLGAYLYAAGNPIGFSDPDGLEPTRTQRAVKWLNDAVAGAIEWAVAGPLGGCANANAPRPNEKVYNAPTDAEVALNIVAAHVAPRVSGAIVNRLLRSGATRSTAATVATADATEAVGSFAAQDVAFGLARPGGQSGALLKFAGQAVPGTRAPLSEATSMMAPGAAKNLAIAQDTIAFAKQTLQQTGGKLRFNLDGFDTAKALAPGSASYNSVTSTEFRGVLGDSFLRSNSSFYRDGVDVTKQVLGGAQ